MDWLAAGSVAALSHRLSSNNAPMVQCSIVQTVVGTLQDIRASQTQLDATESSPSQSATAEASVVTSLAQLLDSPCECDPAGMFLAYIKWLCMIGAGRHFLHS